MAADAAAVVFAAAKLVYEAVDTMRANKARGRRLGDRVRTIVDAVSPKIDALPVASQRARVRLVAVLGDAHVFLSSFVLQPKWRALLSAFSAEARFADLHAELSTVSADLQLVLAVVGEDARRADREAAERDRAALLEALQRAAKSEDGVVSALEISVDQAAQAAAALDPVRADIFTALGGDSARDVDNLRRNLLSMSSRSKRTPETTDTISPWEVTVLERIGSGGFGTVFRGRWQETTDVAVKMLHEVTAETRREFAAEADVWSRLRHENVLLLLGWCLTAERPCLVCPLMRNGNLAQYVRAHDAELGVGDRVRLLWDVAKGVAYLHGRSPPIVHRDLKGLNCLVGDAARVVLCDFGFAKAKETSSRSGSSKSVGTMRWMAPELLDEVGASMASDMWALGMIVFEVFSGGCIPYEKLANDAGVIKAMLSGNRPELPPTVPDDLLAFTVRCWSVVPSERPLSLNAAADLEL